MILVVVGSLRNHAPRSFRPTLLPSACYASYSVGKPDNSIVCDSIFDGMILPSDVPNQVGKVRKFQGRGGGGGGGYDPLKANSRGNGGI